MIFEPRCSQWASAAHRPHACYARVPGRGWERDPGARRPRSCRRGRWPPHACVASMAWLMASTASRRSRVASIDGPRRSPGPTCRSVPGGGARARPRPRRRDPLHRRTTRSLRLDVATQEGVSVTDRTSPSTSTPRRATRPTALRPGSGRRLRGAVGREVGSPDPGRARGHQDDPAPAALDHRLAERVRRGEHGGAVALHHRQVCVEVLVEELEARRVAPAL